MPRTKVRKVKQEKPDPPSLDSKNKELLLFKKEIIAHCMLDHKIFFSFISSFIFYLKIWCFLEATTEIILTFLIITSVTEARKMSCSNLIALRKKCKIEDF